MRSHPLSAALANAELIIDRATLDAAISAMAVPIARDYAGEVPVYLTGEFFADGLVLPNNVSVDDVEVPLRNLGIFLK